MYFISISGVLFVEGAGMGRAGAHGIQYKLNENFGELLLVRSLAYISLL